MARKLTQKVIRKVEVRIDGKDWPVVITHNVLIDCEELTGMNVLTGDVNITRPSAKLLRALLYLALKGAGAKYTLEKVGEFINPQNIVKVQEAILTAWAAAMPEPEEDDQNPMKAAG
jgi:hypothetical protein